MIEPKKAAFSFINFKIPQFSYNDIYEDNDELSIGFDPSGIYHNDTGEFELQFKFIAFSPKKDKKNLIEATFIAIFKFNSPLNVDEIPVYFYKNAIAIVFPYLRSFISTLTLQANIRLLNLGLLNLSDLEQPLKQNTVVL